MALTDLFSDIADAIREKDGTTDDIVASDFPDRIRAIQIGSGVTLDSIEITTPPNKVSYSVGDFFDPTGMSVWANFSNGYGLYVNHSDLTFEPDGPLDEWTDSVTIQFQWGVETASVAQIIKVRTFGIYGAEWNGTNTTKLSRTDDAVGFIDPVAAVGNGAGTSPFNDILPWCDMVREVQDGNELVAIPKYWLKVSYSPFKVQIANQPADGFQVSPAHRDRGDGQGERDVVYIGRYECDTSYMSRSGRVQKVLMSLSGFRSNIAAIGEEYWQADFALQLTWWFLYIVEFADWNGQVTIGQGNASSSGGINTGGTDSMTYHTGRAAGTDGQTAVQYRWIENPWGNIREWRDGIVFSGANICTYNNPSNFKDTYNGAGGTVRSNKRATSDGWIKAWGFDSGDASFIYPSAVGGSGTEYIPDYCYYNSGVCALNVGGSAGVGTMAGPFYLYGYDSPSNTSGGLGSRIMKLPNRKQSA